MHTKNRLKYVIFAEKKYFSKWWYTSSNYSLPYSQELATCLHILNHMNLVHSLPTYHLKIHFYIISLVTLSSSKSSLRFIFYGQNSVCISLPRIQHDRPISPLFLQSPNKIWWIRQVMEFFTGQFPPTLGTFSLCAPHTFLDTSLSGIWCTQHQPFSGYLSVNQKFWDKQGTALKIWKNK